MLRISFVFFCLMTFAVSSFAQSYELSKASNNSAPSSEVIARVNFGTLPFDTLDITNPSVNGTLESICTGYSDFTVGNVSGVDGNSDNSEFVTGVVKSQTYDLEVLGGFCSSSFNTGANPNRALKVFIDYNDDGDFLDAGEQVWVSSDSEGFQQVNNPLFTTSITIPLTAVVGELRMRIVYRRVGDNPLNELFWNIPGSGSEGTYPTGETEDYSIIVTGYVDNIASVDPNCAGGSTGEIQITPDVSAPAGVEFSINGLVGPWTTTLNYTGLIPGNYDIWARDQALAPNYVYEQYEVTINDPAGVTFNANVSSDYGGQDISCAGFSDGELTITASGGDNSNYTYQFVDQQTGSVGSSAANVIGSLSADTYEITVIDAQGCTSPMQEFIVVDPSQISIGGVVIISDYNGEDVSCFGACDAELIINPGGGTPPYIYTVDGNNNGGNNIVQNVCAGMQAIMIEDVNNCSFMTNVPIGEPALLSVTSVTTTSNYNGEDVSCTGSMDGAIDIVASGGTGSYSYGALGVAPFNTTDNISGLASGNYPVAVQDDNGCISTTLNHTINDPTPLTLNAVVSSAISCNGLSDGEVTLQVIGGTGTYQYSDDIGVTFQTSGVFTGQGSGSNIYVVADENTCQVSLNFNIPEPSLVTLSAAITSDFSGQDISCFGADDAVITINAAGGSPGNYAYSLSGSVAQAPVPPGNQLNNIAAGNYTVTAYDQNGCPSISQAINVNEPTDLQINNIALISDVDCNGGANGEMLIDANGGTGNYSYFVDVLYNSSNQSPFLVSDLTSGIYPVVVSDENGCFTIATNQIINEPTLLEANVSTTNLGCNGDDSGSAFVSYFGGTSPYSVMWSNNLTSNSITNILAGQYSVAVTDDNDCAVSVDFEITEPLLSTQADQIICFGGNIGEIELTLLNPNPASIYSVLWDDPNAQTTLTATNLSAGVYTAFVTDQFGCVLSASDVINQPDSMSVFVDHTYMCVEKPYSSATVFTSGGLDPYYYDWNTGENTEQITINAGGPYSVEVTDYNGCQQVINFNVDPIIPLSVNYARDNPSCKDNEDGQIITEITGGYPPFQYNWSNATQDSILSGVPEGTYFLDGFDSHGCYFGQSVDLIANSSSCLEVYSAFSPNGDQNNDFWYIENIELYPDALVEVFNRWGDRVYGSKRYLNAWDGGWNGTFKDNILPSATYYYVITLNNEESQYVGTVTIVR